MYLCAVNNMVVYNYNGMKNDGLMLRGDTTLLWQFDGGYVHNRVGSAVYLLSIYCGANKTLIKEY